MHTLERVRGRSLMWLLAALLLLASVLAPAADEQDVWSGVERIVAVGDVHGDYDQFHQLLEGAGIIDSKSRWTGGRAHFVQTGDVLDRGDHSRKVMDLLMKLEGQARKAGGRVHALLGNHEAMNIYGDLRYVAPGEYEAFRSVQSRELRDAFYERYVEMLKDSPPPEGLPEFDAKHREEWEARTPLGWVEHRQQFSSRGRYGKWLRENNTVIRINDTLFLHGGIGPLYADRPIRQLNRDVRSELADFSKLAGGIVMDPEGPLWYRGLVFGSEIELQPHVDGVLDTHGVKRIVVGHSVTDGAVMPRFGGKVIAIDVGLSEAYGGRMACLLIESGRAWAFHRGKRLELPADSERGLLAYLRQAAELDPAPSPLQARITKLEEALIAR